MKRFLSNARIRIFLCGSLLALSAFRPASSAEAARSASADTATGIENRYPGYRLAFAEEFDGDSLNLDVWDFETGLCRNHEDQYYQKENVSVADGCLRIEARKERVKNEAYVEGSSDWKTKNPFAEYTSSSIFTRHSDGDEYCWGPGIYEVRAKVPVATGYWPAIWSCGTKYEWPCNGEIDMMEYYGDAIHANVAWGGKGRFQATWDSEAPRMSHFAPDFADSFHIWRMEWTDSSIKLFLDDELLNETDLDDTVNPRTDWFPFDNVNPYRGDHKQFMILNFALGGDNGGSLEDTPLPATYYVDYVRIYQPDTD